MPEGFREKSPEELERQVEQVSEHLEREIIQPTSNGEVFDMSVEEIKEKFPLRYQMYLNSLRANKSGIEIPKEEKQEMQEWLSILNNLDTYIENHKTYGEERTLRERQFTVFEEIRDFLEEGGKEGYVKLPTGAGKTVIFSEFIEAIGVKTLIVVPTKILVGQTEDRLEEFAEDLDVGKIYTDAKEYGNNVTIITYKSLVAKLEDGSLNPDDYRCLILDEAHTALSDKKSEAVKKFSKSIKLGFTATPKYSEDKYVGQLLNTEIHSLEVREAAEEGVISPFSVIIAETRVDLTNVEVKKNGEYSDEELEIAINIESRNTSAVELYQKMFNNELAVVYCSGIDHAENVAKLFLEHGIEASVIHGKQSTKEQRSILEKYKNGEIKVLCNADILIAGFDEPKASVCLNLVPTLSPVVAEQRGGRVLRLDKDNHNKQATIVDFVDQNNNKKAQPITFAEIAGASVVYKNTSFESNNLHEDVAKERVQRINPNIKIEGLKVITDSEEVMRVVGRMVEGKAEQAPEGWINKVSLGKLCVGRSGSSMVVRKYRTTQPDWFKEYLAINGHLLEYYSPELVLEIEKMPINREQAPEGWQNKRDIGKRTGAGYKKIVELVERYRVVRPEWFGNYVTRPGKLIEYYSPELVEKIKETFKKPPQGWMTMNSMMGEFTRGLKKLEQMTNEYRESNPEWFKDFFGKAGVVEYHSPELVEKIRGQLSKIEKAPELWMTIAQLTRELERGEKFIKNITKKYRATNPEWFKDYLDERGKLREFLSPVLVDKVNEIAGSLQEAPGEWMHNTDVAQMLGSGDKKVKKIADKYRENHSSWFKKYINLSGKASEFYSPELIDKIEEELKSE